MTHRDIHNHAVRRPLHMLWLLAWATVNKIVERSGVKGWLV